MKSQVTLSIDSAVIEQAYDAAAALGVSRSAFVSRALEYLTTMATRNQAALAPWASQPENRARAAKGAGKAKEPLPVRVRAVLRAESQTIQALAGAVGSAPGDVWVALRYLVAQGAAVVHRETGEVMPDPLLAKPMRAVPGAHTARLVGGGR